MADILIRGMEMPTDGHWGTVSIPFYIHGDGSVSDSKGHIIGSAVPIPPHGRLGDLDALIKKIPVVSYEIHENIRTLVESAPTIIPASEGYER